MCGCDGLYIKVKCKSVEVYLYPELPVSRLTICQCQFYRAFYFTWNSWQQLVIHFLCRILCLELETLVDGQCYAKHASYNRLTICLCAAINLWLYVDGSCFALSYPSYCSSTLPVVSTATDHHTDGCQPREGSRTALVVNPYMHSHTNIIANTHISTVFNAMSSIILQRASVKVLVNDKL